MTQNYKDYKNLSGRITKTQMTDFLFVLLHAPEFNLFYHIKND